MFNNVSSLRMVWASFAFGVATGALASGLMLLFAPFLWLISIPKQRVRSFIVALTFGWLWSAVAWYGAEREALPLSADKFEATLIGEVNTVFTSGDFSRLDITADHGARYQVSCYQCPYTFSVGDQWQLRVRLKPIVSFHNPQGFDYRNWMLAQGTHGKGYILTKAHGNERLAAGIDSYKSGLKRILPGNEYPLLNALVLGNRDYLAAWQKRTLFDAGISHLFVVSGLHVGLVALFLMGLTAWVARVLLLVGGYSYQWMAVAVAVMAGVSYAWISGFAVPALRAAMMLILALAFWYWPGKRSPLDAWLCAVVLVAIFYPLQFYLLGTWLSFTIVLALIVGFAGSGKVTFWQALIKSQKLAFLAGAIVLVLFNQYVSVSGIIINLILIPFFSFLILPSSLMALLIASLGSELGIVYVEEAMHCVLYFLHDNRDWVDWWPNIHADNKWLVMSGLVLLLLPRVLYLRFLALAVVVVGLFMSASSPDRGGFKLYMLDVGQGSSALVQTENHAILVDTGASFGNGMSMADYVVLPFLRQRGIDQLDRLHITHEDNDHNGGVRQLRRRSREVVRQENCKANSWVWDDVLFQQFQSPSHKQGNDGSCLLKVSAVGGASLLFSGDIEKSAERALLASSQDLAADVLMVPHHGSKTSSSHDFITRVSPSVALISAGVHSRYGHPHEQVLQRFVQENIKVLNTGSHGAIEVDFPPRQAAHIVSTYRPYHRIIE